ncbi:hypothetical protein HAX54_033531 [Datura stramonium]|uniref:Cytochrome f large domain-containing protein n=1 Tax=Datura stramonium TaxID=4076 RepID=A0ABS8RLQ0_DATST|nr:hypothetical protein [Datura stramonium]
MGNALPLSAGYENPLEGTRRIVCANCHLANKPVEIEVLAAAGTELVDTYSTDTVIASSLGKEVHDPWAFYLHAALLHQELMAAPISLAATTGIALAFIRNEKIRSTFIWYYSLNSLTPRYSIKSSFLMTECVSIVPKRLTSLLLSWYTPLLAEPLFSSIHRDKMYHWCQQFIMEERTPK